MGFNLSSQVQQKVASNPAQARYLTLLAYYIDNDGCAGNRPGTNSSLVKNADI